MLKRKYKLLFDVLSKTILGISFSPEGLTSVKLHCLAAMVDRASNINWHGALKAVLVQEHQNFGVNERREVYLKKRIGNLNKVAVILRDKLPQIEWDRKGIKNYKALLNDSAKIFGPSDSDPQITIKNVTLCMPYVMTLIIFIVTFKKKKSFIPYFKKQAPGALATLVRLSPLIAMPLGLKDYKPRLLLVPIFFFFFLRKLADWAIRFAIMVYSGWVWPQTCYRNVIRSLAITKGSYA